MTHSVDPAQTAPYEDSNLSLYRILRPIPLPKILTIFLFFPYRPPRPDLQSIADSALKLAEDMERQKELLEDLKKHVRHQVFSFTLTQDGFVKL